MEGGGVLFCMIYGDLIYVPVILTNKYLFSKIPLRWIRFLCTRAANKKKRTITCSFVGCLFDVPTTC